MSSLLDRPVIVLGAPRSGSTLLFSILSSHPELWSAYREPEAIFAERLHPSRHGWDRGNALDRADLTGELCAELRRAYYDRSHNVQALLPAWRTPIYRNARLERLRGLFAEWVVSPLLKPDRIRIADKNPKHCFRVPFLAELFPDATFVFLLREPRANIASLMEGWNTPGAFETYDVPVELDVRGFSGTKWNFLLPPGWRDVARGTRLVDVCAFQYRRANEAALASLAELDPASSVRVRFEDVVARPVATVRELCERLDLEYTGGLRRMAETLPPMNTTSEPAPDKWRAHAAELRSVMDAVSPVARRLGYGPEGAE